MKSTFALAAMLLMVSIASASNSTLYTVDSWLEVSRSVSFANLSPCHSDTVGYSCSNTGAIGSPATGYTETTVVLSFRNIGTADREDISATESLTYVPEGATLSFSPEPSSFDGRVAIWQIGSIPAGQSKQVSYSFSAATSEGLLGRMLPVKVDSEPLGVYLSAPLSAKAGEPIPLRLSTASGQAVSGAIIFASSPDGGVSAVKTDRQGAATFSASNDGFYTYSVASCKLMRLASTSVKNATVEAPATSAAAADTGIVPSIIGALPILAGILVVLFIITLVYNFISSSRAEADEPQAPATQPSQYYPAQQQASPQPGGKASSPMTYSQSFNFSNDAKKDSVVRQVTSDVLASRKRALAASEATVKEEGNESVRPFVAPSPQPREAARKEDDDSGKPLPASASKPDAKHIDEDDEVERELAELEAQAEEGGERSEIEDDEESIEETLAKLEEIRRKLREQRESMGSENDEQGLTAAKESETDEDEAASEPDKEPQSPRKPAQPAKKAATKQKSGAGKKKR